MIIAGNRLRMIDNSNELITGEVVLETTQAFACEGLILLFEYNHIPGKTDTGFQVECGVRFQYDDLRETIFMFPMTEGVDVQTYYRNFPVGPWKWFYPIPMSVRNSFTRIFITWAGGLTNLSDLTVHFYPNAVI